MGIVRGREGSPVQVLIYTVVLAPPLKNLCIPVVPVLLLNLQLDYSQVEAGDHVPVFAALLNTRLPSTLHMLLVCLD